MSKNRVKLTAEGNESEALKSDNSWNRADMVLKQISYRGL